MPRILIEVSHEPHVEACARCVQLFLATGSHFLTHADWGCMDGDHRAWIIVEVDSKEEARCILPPIYRASAKIVELKKFLNMEEVDRQIKQAAATHKPSS